MVSPFLSMGHALILERSVRKGVRVVATAAMMMQLRVPIARCRVGNRNHERVTVASNRII